LDSSKYDKLKKQLTFNLREQEIIKELGIAPEVFLPLLFSLKFGGDWSFSTESLKVLAIKDKLTRYNSEKMAGSTLEIIHLFSNPRILKEEGVIHRLEKCSQKKEREIVERPFKVELDGENITKAVLDPRTLKITVKRVQGPLSFEGSAAFGISHEMDHLTGSEKVGRKCLWDFSYELED
jgi:predicted metalloprotease